LYFKKERQGRKSKEETKLVGEMKEIKNKINEN
jgi:hypothetical protein